MRDVRIWATVVLLLNVTAVAANAWVSWKARTLRVFAPGQPFSLPDGTTLEGTRVASARLSSRSCYLVRYGSRLCVYSTADVGVLEGLEQHLKERGCVTLFLAPIPELFPEPIDHRRINLAFVSLSSAVQVPFAETPTTVVVDRNGVIRWSKVGSLGDRDVAEALGSLTR